VSGARIELWLFIAQRVSAAILAPIVLIHLATMIYAVNGGLSAAEILGRTQANLVWTLLYGLFVLAAAVHAPIGVRTILREMTTWRGPGLDVGVLLLGLLILGLGLRAVGLLT
jgi:fumarate reductase subunit C